MPLLGSFTQEKETLNHGYSSNCNNHKITLHFIILTPLKIGRGLLNLKFRVYIHWFHDPGTLNHEGTLVPGH